jgi:hypothetical protein
LGGLLHWTFWYCPNSILPNLEAIFQWPKPTFLTIFMQL